MSRKVAMKGKKKNRQTILARTQVSRGLRGGKKLPYLSQKKHKKREGKIEICQGKSGNPQSENSRPGPKKPCEKGHNSDPP